ncbi:MAG: NAD-dependent protein deacylase [Agarilytica sp.]
MISAKSFKSVVVLTGAGVSAESGLKTFRDSGGLWEGHKVEDIATPDAFARNPSMVHEFYNMRRKQLLKSAAPNAAHKALANFEQNFNGNFLLVTQNVDNLHEQGGSKNIIHMHGELLKAHCIATEQVFEIEEDIDTETLCPCCQTRGNLRPHIVWFGEIPLQMERIEKALAQCDLFVSIGTSGQVYPAAGFVQVASWAKATTVELNMEPSDGCSHFQHAYYGPATEVVDEFFSS